MQFTDIERIVPRVHQRVSPMPSTRNPADDFPDDLRLQKDEPDVPLFAEEKRAAKSRPSSDPLDAPLDEPLDDFQPIEPDDKPYSFVPEPPPLPKGPRIAPPKSSQSQSSPAVPRRERPVPLPRPPKKWLLPVGIALAILTAAVPLVLVLATGSESKPSSALPPYPPGTPWPMSYPQMPIPGQPGFGIAKDSGQFGRVFTPGKDPEPGPNEIGKPTIVTDLGLPAFPGFPKLPNPPDFPSMPKFPNINAKMPEAASGGRELAVGLPPSFTRSRLTILPRYSGKPLEILDFPNRPIVASCVGGKGRYLFLAVANEPKIVAFDLTTGNQMPAIPCEYAGSSNVHLVAGADVLVAIDGDTGRATSWRLDNLGSPKVADLGFRPIRSALMGTATNGPLFVSYTATGPRLATLDPVSLERVRYDFESDEQRKNFAAATLSAIDANGALVGGTSTASNPPNLFWQIGPRTIRQTRSIPGNVTALAISPDRDTVVTNLGASLLSRDDGGVQNRKTIDWPVPTLATTASFSVDGQPVMVAFRAKEVEVWNQGIPNPIAVFSKDDKAVNAFPENADGSGIVHMKPTDFRRIFYVARTNVVAIVGKERVVLWHADPARQPNAGVKPLQPRPVPIPAVVPMPAVPKGIPVPIDGRPPSVVARQGRIVLFKAGQPNYYPIVVAPVPTYPLNYEIKTGPEGLKIDAKGRITWDAPEAPDDMDYDAVVRIWNEDKKLELTDAFKIRLIPKKK